MDGHSKENGLPLELMEVSIAEFLDQDSRPTFVVDLHPHAIPADNAERLKPVFCNATLLSHSGLLDVLTGEAEIESLQSADQKVPYMDFKAWVTSVSKYDESADLYPVFFLFCGMLWTGSTIRKRWRIISGNQCYRSSDVSSGDLSSGPPSEIAIARSASSRRIEVLSRPESQSTASVADRIHEIIGFSETPSESKESSALTAQEGSSASDISHASDNEEYLDTVVTTPIARLGASDWTADILNGEVSSHVAFVRQVNWSSTALGPMTAWSAEMRQMANFLMSSPHPGALYWGDDLILMYNEAYRDGIAGSKHPYLMGASFRDGFSEISDELSGLFEECRRTGKPLSMVNQMLPMERHGFLVERYFSWSFVPIYGGGSEILGFYNAPFETTKNIINDRRTRTLLQVGEKLAEARNVKCYWEKLMEGLEPNTLDFPFALLYSVVEDSSTDEESSISNSSGSSLALKSCVLEGSLGVPENHVAAPKKLDLKRSRAGFIPSFREATRTRLPTMLKVEDGTLPEELIEGIQWRGFGEVSERAIIIPIRPTTGENVMGFLVFGLNPRRPWDDDFQFFVQLLNRQLATALASVVLYEDEIRRGEISALEQVKLLSQLDEQQTRIRTMAEVAPVGMFYIDSNGLMLEANSKWFEITGYHKDRPPTTFLWMDALADESRAVMEAGWNCLTIDRKAWSSELKLKKTLTDSITGEVRDRWILTSAQPDMAPDGSLRSILGAITDITEQKANADHALARAQLSEKLLSATQLFRRFSDLAPGGLVIMDGHGSITYANDQWFAITGHPREVSDFAAPVSWGRIVHESCADEFKSKWEALMGPDHTPINMEIKSSKPWESCVGGKLVFDERWILVAVVAEIGEDGGIVRILGCITDISRIKWAEHLQNARLEEAEETRRQQNNFIDITSHEMRNPLSAMIQCADGISSSLNEYRTGPKISGELTNELIDSCIDAAETVMLCAQHQKSIIDDILTLSKLDSNLLMIVPDIVRPVDVVRRALKMVDSELKKYDMLMEFNPEPSLATLQVDWVLMDAARVLQILINLLTNAIKFTQVEDERRIVVSVGASSIPPSSENERDIEYFPAKVPKTDTTFGEAWGTGEVIYLRVKVQDTGVGLSPNEKKLLFLRFSQASPKTHTVYGGSGLGLFISRQLTELQGGEIGVASESGFGSTFAFFIKVRRTNGSGKSLSRPGTSSFNPSSSSLSNTKTISADGGEISVPEVVVMPTAAKKEKGKERDSTTTLPSTSISAIPIHSSITHTDSLFHILIVEDNIVNQKVLAKQLRKAGCNVTVANHGLEALDYLRETKFYEGMEVAGRELSAVLLDLEMPVMDGLTCIRIIREWEKRAEEREMDGLRGRLVRHIPVIAITANARREQVQMAMQAGMDDVLPKPFRIIQLMPKIEALLANNK